MTGLSAFKPKTENVEFSGGKFAVRGLALEDISVLMQSHYDSMSALFDQYVGEAALRKVDQDTGGHLDLGNVQGVALEALKIAPALLGDTIARAADEHENPHYARLLPIGVQIDAIGKIVNLTLEAEGGMEKLVGTISNLAASLSTAVGSRSR